MSVCCVSCVNTRIHTRTHTHMHARTCTHARNTHTLSLSHAHTYTHTCPHKLARSNSHPTFLPRKHTRLRHPCLFMCVTHTLPRMPHFLPPSLPHTPVNSPTQQAQATQTPASLRALLHSLFYMNESCHTRMCYVTNESVMSHMDGSWHT